MKKVFVIVTLAASSLLAQGKYETLVVPLKNRNARSIAEMLPTHSLTMRISNDFNTITVSGPPEDVRAAEALIKQYDTPLRQAEFVLRVIEASSAANKPDDAADLVPAELKSLLRYTRYGLRDVAILRSMESDPAQARFTLAGGMAGYLYFRVRDAQPKPMLEVNIRMTSSGGTVLKTQGGGESISRPELLATSATVKSGETVVLGASKMIDGGGNALIVLLTAKLLP